MIIKDLYVAQTDLTEQEKIAHVMETVKNRWYYSYPYSPSNAMEFTSKHPSDLMNKETFRINALYINLLFRSLSEKHKLIDSEDALEEVAYWNKEGGLCVYLSVLLYALLLENKTTNRHDLRYIQGYTYYQPTNPIWNSFFTDTSMLNFHAWLSYKDSVLDFSIGQENGFIQFREEQYIIGKIPEAITMIGFKESHKIVQKYVEMFASHQGISKKQWLLKHQINSLQTAMDSILFISNEE